MRKLLLISSFLLISTSMMSCSIFKSKSKIENVAKIEMLNLDLTSWQLDSLINFKIENIEKPATLTFRNENKISGFLGCNGYGGKYTLNGEKVSFLDIFSTKRYCFEGSKTETQFLSALIDADKVGMDKDSKLLLMKGKKVLAVLHKIDFIAE